MAQRYYTGQPFSMPNTTKEGQAYNNARRQIDVKYLGDFLYDNNFPMSARNNEVGTKYPKLGYKAQFGFWEVTNKGQYIKSNRPGEREVPLANGGKALVSYVATPRICVDTNQSDLFNPCIWGKGHQYVDMVDPGAVVLAINGSGVVKDAASIMVDEATAYPKSTLKVGSSATNVANSNLTYFTGFANRNHSDTMVDTILRSSLPDIHRQAPGEVKPVALDLRLNPVLYNGHYYDATQNLEE